MSLEIIVNEIKKLSQRGQVLVAIDGMCASGKTTFALLLATQLDANIFHMDDFFLYPEMRTETRLAQVGGNVNYERFKEQVLGKIKLNIPFQYEIYSCKTGEIITSPMIIPKTINIIEGAYSLHPYFENSYDYKIMLTVNNELQKERILKRNGEFMLARFISEWIPNENDYFEQCKIKSQCDIIL